MTAPRPRPLDAIDDDDVEGHRLAGNDNETVVDDEDVAGHRLAGNDNETVVDATIDPDAAGDPVPGPEEHRH